MKEKKGSLILEDGSIFTGTTFGYEASRAGEVVFNTGMVGYPQALTDPSYAGQILTFTYPIIGNYGVASKKYDRFGISTDFESDHIHVQGIIASEYNDEYSHWNAQQSLGQWLKKEKIPALAGIDTRALTRKIRTTGVMLGKIIIDNDVDFFNPDKENLVAKVSRKKVQKYGKGKYTIVAVDCGIKNNILKYLLRYDVTLKVVPWDYDFTQEPYDGLLLSNGPGDPTRCEETIRNIQKAFTRKKPILGVCLGNQLMALASGAKTYKLKFGHRGHNQPCAEVSGKGYITSQNHGFAVDTKTLPTDWEELFYNINDKSNEGIRHRHLPYLSAQFHPEGSGGPQDTDFLFDTFFSLIKKYA